ncbi:hypothetical protein [Peribacillus muralis]|uniref:hypothetical protein n=1 Tax=Peribacillus muralis TaxID=264697 RepID=UPI00367335E4
MKNTIKSALTNGMKKKKNSRSDHLPIDVLLSAISLEVQKKCPYLNEISFEEFAFRVENDSKISTYEIIIMTYMNYEDQYNEHYEVMVENIKQNEFIFKDLTEYLDRTPIEKITLIMNTEVLKDIHLKILKNYENKILHSDLAGFYTNIYIAEPDEETLIRLLSSSEEDKHIYQLLPFLLQEARYKDDKYAELTKIALLLIYEQELEEEKKVVQGLEKDINRLEEETQTLKEDKDKVEQLRENDAQELEEEKKVVQGLETEVNRLEEETQTLKEDKDKVEQLRESVEKELHLVQKNLIATEKKLDIETKKRIKLNYVLTQNEPLNLVFFRLIAEHKFSIITKDKEQLEDTPFESISFQPSVFKKQVKDLSAEPFRNQMLFVTRGSFSTGGDWYNFKQFLNKHGLTYEELGEYNITSYIKEILEYFNQKEILVYADDL